MRILLVEDDAEAAAVLARGLREQAYAVDVAEDGEAALEAAAANDYDVVVLDRMLPLRDGVSVCRALRGDGLAVPVLMLTARDALADRIEGLDAGADDYLTKPFELDELLARVRALLRRGPVLKPAVLTVGDLTIDALVVPLAIADGPLSAATVSAEAPLRLPLGGSGIRSIEQAGGGGFLIVAGGVTDASDFRLLTWSGTGAPQPVTDFPVELKPEGVARMLSGGRSVTVVLGDSGRYAVLD